MTITSAQVKELREKSGAGMMDCKRALQEANGDVTVAIEELRKKGIATAAKKSSRSAKEGLLGYKIDGSKGVFVEISCETDFVAKTDDFKNFVSNITDYVTKNTPSDLESLMKMDWDGQTVEQCQVALVAKIGENSGIRRFIIVESKDGEKIIQYIHSGDKIASMVVFADPENKLDVQLGREIAMHVAAMSPKYVKPNDVPTEIVEKEKEIIKAQMGESKKPPEILEKIIGGKMNKHFSEICLNEQVFVKDLESKRTISKVLSSIDKNISVKSFIRYQVGEEL